MWTAAAAAAAFGMLASESAAWASDESAGGSGAVCPAAAAAAQESPASSDSSDSSGSPQSSSHSAGYVPAYRYSLEHTGSLGLIAGISGNYGSLEKSSCPTCETSQVITGWEGSLDLAGTLALGWEGAEFVLRFSLTRLGEEPGEAVSLGLRHYFGKDEWKTFLSLEALGVIRPIGAGGLRGGFGAAWDFSPLFGLWAEFSALFAMGEGRFFGARIGLGIQARTYLF